MRWSEREGIGESRESGRSQSGFEERDVSLDSVYVCVYVCVCVEGEVLEWFLSFSKQVKSNCL